MKLKGTASRLRSAATVVLSTAVLGTLVASGAVAQTTAPAPTPRPSVSVFDAQTWEVHEDKEMPGSLSAPLSAFATPTPPVVAPSCDGDGTSGQRVQLLYVRGQNQPDRLDQFRSEFVTRASKINGRFVQTSEARGERREVRYVHDSACVPTVTRVVIPQADMNSHNGVGQALSNQGYNRNDRKYLFWAENQGCGLAWGPPGGNSNPGHDNVANRSVGYAMISMQTGSCFDAIDIELHELLHTMGAVQSDAPKATSNGHCYFRGDIMCYDDGGIPASPGTLIDCQYPGTSWIDCNRDTYFHPKPQPGSYLSNHWNVANSSFLIRPAHSLPAIASLVSVTGPAADLDNAWTADGTRVKAEGNYRPEAQRWNLTRLSDGKYRLNSRLAPGKVLDSNTDRTRIVDGSSYFAQLWTQSNTENQKWTLRPVGTGRYEIVGHEGGCLTAEALGSVLGVWTCNGADKQRWEIQH
ncbi:RICIN domain-containing protein [Streptomyces sp. NPDC051567]|uniref:RICIN domain-containing protein n=1 Tax=Streptomyces sp. NPDC051567 TaxID=3365660 RepID=UPI0037BCC207